MMLVLCMYNSKSYPSIWRLIFSLFPYSLVGGGAVSNVDPDAASVNPAFRVMLSDLTIAFSWNVTTASVQDVQNVRENVTTLMNGVRAVTPAGGAYVNEVCCFPKFYSLVCNSELTVWPQPDLLEPNWQTSYWGDHYPRLLAFKKNLDPKDLLIVLQGVNSEQWDPEILCKTV